MPEQKSFTVEGTQVLWKHYRKKQGKEDVIKFCFGKALPEKQWATHHIPHATVNACTTSTALAAAVRSLAAEILGATIKPPKNTGCRCAAPPPHGAKVVLERESPTADASVDERGSEGSSRTTSGDENSATTPRNLDEPRGATNEETNEDVSKIKETPVVLGTPAFSAAAADAGRPPTYADDLEALVFTVAYLRAGTFPWCPPSARGDFEAVAAHKAGAVAEDLATDEADQEWMGALLARARAVPFGATFDLAACRGIVRRAFARVSGGARMRDTPFDWEQAGIVAVTTEMK